MNTPQWLLRMLGKDQPLASTIDMPPHELTHDELVERNQELGRAQDQIRDQRRQINAVLAAMRAGQRDASVPGQTIDVKAN